MNRALTWSLLALVALSITPSLAQPAPAASGPTTPAKVANVTGLLAWFGDTPDPVKAAYHTDQEVELPGPLAGPQAQPFLWLKAKALLLFSMRRRTFARSAQSVWTRRLRTKSMALV
jgi:hypothetical protein